MNAEAVLAYLQQHPEFLLKHARTLGIRPAAGKIQTFAEAKRLAQEHKTAKMSHQLAEMMQAADANFQTTAKLISCAKRLLAADGTIAVCQAFSGSLNQDFSLPIHTLCLPDAAANDSYPDTVRPISSNHPAHAALLSIPNPVCTNHLAKPLMALLPAGGQNLESFLCLPIKAEYGNIAVLIAGDADADRFQNGMPTDLVEELANLFAAAFIRCKGKP